VPGRRLLSESSHPKRPHISNSGKVAVNMHDARIVKQGGFGDQKIGNGNAVPRS
jgi:hypothetical protein